MQATLQPPGIHTLSDGVIGSVAQRSSRNVGRQIYGYINEQQSRLYSPSRSCANATAGLVTLAKDGMRREKRNLDDVRTQYSTTRVRDTKRYKLSGSERIDDKEEDDTTESRRKYYRKKQQRYRERQRKREKMLENSTRRLKDEIGQLKRLHDQLSFQVPRCLTIWIVATEYLRIMRRGISNGAGNNDIELLQTTMAPDVLIDTGSGVDALVKKWNLFTQWFPDVRIQLKQLKQITEQSIVALTTTSFTITTRGMQGAFPHLFKAREGSRCAQIAARLRDQHVVLQGSVRFDWDEKSKHVIRLQHQADMMSMLLEMLGNLEDVALVFNGAHITPECVVRDDIVWA
ncbi:hypothetical protein F443_12864 [Phytophthora nicotianae P1569]|uniref:BZIP domain-containing protein n=2 Tax=Phytophthora nicotianae TaxID=4792 RepID=V9ETY7_PHYNI|nr:hypothetical protein F443_12864 [Phytophthora nicotianae P1569]